LTVRRYFFGGLLAINARAIALSSRRFSGVCFAARRLLIFGVYFCERRKYNRRPRFQSPPPVIPAT
jgi:hypothetical protein